MKRYGKLFDSGYWLDAQWWYPEADFLQLGESYDAQGIAYNALAADKADLLRVLGVADARVKALEAALRDLIDYSDITKHVDADAVTERVKRARVVLGLATGKRR